MHASPRYLHVSLVQHFLNSLISRVTRLHIKFLQLDFQSCGPICEVRFWDQAFCHWTFIFDIKRPEWASPISPTKPTEHNESPCFPLSKIYCCQTKETRKGWVVWGGKHWTSYLRGWRKRAWAPFWGRWGRRGLWLQWGHGQRSLWL